MLLFIILTLILQLQNINSFSSLYSINNRIKSIKSNPPFLSLNAIKENILPTLNVQYTSVNLQLINDIAKSIHSNTNQNEYENKSYLTHIDDILKGIKIIEDCLIKGYLPEDDMSWPINPLRDELYKTMSQLSLPFMTFRHPELIPAVIKSLLEISLKFNQQIKALSDETADQTGSTDQVVEDDYSYDQYASQYLQQHTENPSTDETTSIQSLEEKTDNIVNTLVRTFASQWGPSLSGLAVLDELYGSDHGLMAVISSSTAVTSKGGQEGGLGLFDGIW